MTSPSLDLPAWTRRSHPVLLATVLGLLGTACRDTPSAKPPVRIAAASDLALAFEDLAKTFEARTGRPVDVVFGSSGTLARQLAEGAPFDGFASADPAWIDQVVKAGACGPEGRAAIGLGHLVLVTRGGQTPPATLAGLQDPAFRRIAIANPDHAPYGRAAREALTASGLWEALSPRVVFADNVRQALQFVRTGNADAALVAYSLVKDAPEGEGLPVPTTLHAPIRQEVIPCGRGPDPDGGRAFAALVASPDGLAVLARFGFAPPSGAAR